MIPNNQLLFADSQWKKLLYEKWYRLVESYDTIYLERKYPHKSYMGRSVRS